MSVAGSAIILYFGGSQMHGSENLCSGRRTEWRLLHKKLLMEWHMEVVWCLAYVLIVYLDMFHWFVDSLLSPSARWPFIHIDIPAVHRRHHPICHFIIFIHILMSFYHFYMFFFQSAHSSHCELWADRKRICTCSITLWCQYHTCRC